MEQISPAAALAAMTEHQARLRVLLEHFKPAALATRPPNGDWSAIENVRHLLFAEQYHLGRFVAGGLGLGRLGLPQGKHAPITGIDPRSVFDEWERVHAAACAGIDPALPGLGDQLPRLLRHQQAHGRLAARSLSQVTRQAVRLPKPTPGRP